MSFLYFLEEIRNPVLDFLFSIVTLFGEETVFMAVGMIVFWCVNKQKGYYLLSVGFVGTVINQFLKITFRVPRPWVKDPNFTIVESAREAASGYSFPSGHTQTSVGLFGGLALKFRNRAVRIASIALCVLVPLSRMYLGVHTPADVGVSIVIALVLIFALAPLFEKAEKSPKVMYALLFSLTGIMLAYLLFISFWSFPEEVFHVDNVHNYTSAVKNAYTLTGCMLGFLVVYTVDLKWLKFDTKAVWWVQLIKIAGGLVLVLAVKELLRAPLAAILPENTWARMIRYFLMVVTAGTLWPITFKYFAKLGGKKE
ncbi:MAG: phosphatase PAP2 family protein [Clostridia bacterium]|nr:phosphatase PAP2 family protein [Clostridia bacterium]